MLLTDKFRKRAAGLDDVKITGICHDLMRKTVDITFTKVGAGDQRLVLTEEEAFNLSEALADLIAPIGERP